MWKKIGFPGIFQLSSYYLKIRFYKNLLNSGGKFYKLGYVLSKTGLIKFCNKFLFKHNT